MNSLRISTNAAVTKYVDFNSCLNFHLMHCHQSAYRLSPSCNISIDSAPSSKYNIGAIELYPGNWRVQTQYFQYTQSYSRGLRGSTRNALGRSPARGFKSHALRLISYRGGNYVIMKLQWQISSLWRIMSYLADAGQLFFCSFLSSGYTLYFRKQWKWVARQKL